MKKLIYLMFVAVLVTCFVGQVWAEELPESVQKQSRKDFNPSEAWQKFDQSGQVKFLQVQTTASASPEGTGSALDGSIGEILIEIKVVADVSCEKVEWVLQNKGSSIVWVVAGADTIQLDPEAEATAETPLADNYSYIVVDNEGGGKTTFTAKAKCGETEAKTARGKDMTVIWF